MTPSPFVRNTRWMSLLSAVLLLAALVAGGVHHHAAGDSTHPCAVCAVAGAPATLTVSVAIQAPPQLVEALPARSTPAAPRPRVMRAPSRAPPAA